MAFRGLVSRRATRRPSSWATCRGGAHAVRVRAVRCPPPLLRSWSP